MILNQKINKHYAPLFQSKRRYIILMGGRGAGRSTAASQFALAKLAGKTFFRCAIMRYVLGDIRNSIYKEITDRADDAGVKEALQIADNAMIIKYGKNSINAVGFRKSSGDQKSKLKSLANYNTVIIEEADETPEEDFMQLDDTLRTIKGDITIILCLNPPPRTHWIINRWFDLEPSGTKGFYTPKLKAGVTDVEFIRTSYLNNIKNISEHTQKNYEEYKLTKPDHYNNMIRGYVPETMRGKIYTGWKEIEDVPHEARLVGRGIDFGFNPDPAALLDVYYQNGGYIFDEQFYETEASNNMLGTKILNLEKTQNVADSAEPKSIKELEDMGINITPVEKGADSVRAGIKKVQAVKISYTKRSKNLKKEYDNYKNRISKSTGEEIAVEDPNCANHLMSCARYVLMTILPDDPVKERMQEVRRISNQKERLTTSRADVGLG